MPAEYFLDTNILIYSFDQRFPGKRQRARQLLTNTSEWVVSWQVVQEFCNVALHKMETRMLPEDLQDFLRIVLMPNCAVMPTAELYQQALNIHKLTQYRFYDSLILAGAISAGVRHLCSEDLQVGRSFGGLTIVNPFAPES
jgi:predicted nucleic acid-binding protein